MEQMAPLAPSIKTGTLAGNPVSMAAGLACLTELEESAPYERISRFAGRLAEAVRSRRRTGRPRPGEPVRRRFVRAFHRPTRAGLRLL